MKEKWIIIYTLALLTAWCPCLRAETSQTQPTAAKAQGSEIEWEVFVDFDGHIFPSFILSTMQPRTVREHGDSSRIGDPDEHIGAYVKSSSAGSRVNVIVEKTPLFNEAKFSAVLKKAKTEFLITPKLTFDTKALSAVKEQRTIPVTVAVELDGKSIGKKSRNVLVHPIDEALLSFSAGEDQSYDFSSTLAAYVNENHPAVQSLLALSLSSHIVDRFEGYARKSPEAVLLQAYAIWDALETKAIRYTEETPKAETNDKMTTRIVHRIGEVADIKEGSSTDGSVLMASALQGAGLNSSLAIVPGRMIVVLDLDEEGAEQAGLDMTILGHDDTAAAVEKISPDKAAALKDRSSWKSFTQSFNKGSEVFRENQMHFFEQADLTYQLVDISEARFNGVKPLD